MTDRDLARIETKLGVALPEHYRRFLLDHAAAVARAKRTKDRFIPYYTTAAEVVAANAAVRADPWQLPTAGDRKPWPLKYVIVGDDGGDRSWCVNTAAAAATVWLFDQEAGGTFVRAKPASFAAFVKSLAEPPVPDVVVQEVPYFCIAGERTAPPHDSGPAVFAGSFVLRDRKGRPWTCFAQRTLTEVEMLARLRSKGEFPSWFRDPAKQFVYAAGEAGLKQKLAKLKV